MRELLDPDFDRRLTLRPHSVSSQAMGMASPKAFDRDVDTVGDFGFHRSQHRVAHGLARSRAIRALAGGGAVAVAEADKDQFAGIQGAPVSSAWARYRMFDRDCASGRDDPGSNRTDRDSRAKGRRAW